jgi:hypothetical protein
MASFAVMTATIDQVYSSARSLALPDLGVLVCRLLEELSTSLPDTTDEDLSASADAREICLTDASQSNLIVSST